MNWFGTDWPLPKKRIYAEDCCDFKFCDCLFQYSLTMLFQSSLLRAIHLLNPFYRLSSNKNQIRGTLLWIITMLRITCGKMFSLGRLTRNEGVVLDPRECATLGNLKFIRKPIPTVLVAFISVMSFTHWQLESTHVEFCGLGTIHVELTWHSHWCRASTL